MVLVPMRAGVRLATDLYLPPITPAPAIAVRTPYGGATLRPLNEALAAAGYTVVSQQCRGSGDSRTMRLGVADYATSCEKGLSSA
jgi:uncharacterized protein